MSTSRSRLAGPPPALAVIGGSGLYRLAGLVDREEVRPETPFGRPSDPIVVGSLGGRRVAFLPRHGVGHRLPPADVPYRANVYALRALGIRQILSVSAVGSLREEMRPGDLAVPDQLVDLTNGRPNTLFGTGCVVHVSPADPWCARLRGAVLAAASDAVAAAEATLHDGGTYCCMAGPAFSTRAESHLHRSRGFDLIGMTAAPEAVLAREANACLAVLALVTDYDCWRPDEESVSAERVADVMARNADLARHTITLLVGQLLDPVDCACWHALDGAVLTEQATLSAEMRERLEVLR